ncbi:hypothetical protein F2Q69_00009557 [Brassica cretica]|uniref:F-box associated beta-propeller type 3 domain-containing protein n=1 Tax=Brassica cretica TaxID=69181 RepID=A0A8S9PL43_BRACR|nr:hypothetical protein F2Q69_00009557 [Brassica cretica]
MARFSCVSKLWLFILTRPRLLFVLEQVSGELLFFSSPHPQKNPYEKSSPVVAADFLMKFSQDMLPEFRGLSSGLIYFSNMRLSKKGWKRNSDVRNKKKEEVEEDQMWVIRGRHQWDMHQWDMHQWDFVLGDSYLMICFDVRSETFKFVAAECFRDPQSTKLINYKGKLGGIDLTYDDSDAIELSMLILEDVERKEWSKYLIVLCYCYLLYKIW